MQPGQRWGEGSGAHFVWLASGSDRQHVSSFCALAAQGEGGGGSGARFAQLTSLGSCRCQAALASLVSLDSRSSVLGRVLGVVRWEGISGNGGALAVVHQRRGVVGVVLAAAHQQGFCRLALGWAR